MNVDNPEQFKQMDRVLVIDFLGKPIYEGVIVNINDFREPEVRYAVQVEDYDDFIFVSKNNLKKLEELT